MLVKFIYLKEVLFTMSTILRTNSIPMDREMGKMIITVVAILALLKSAQLTDDNNYVESIIGISEKGINYE